MSKGQVSESRLQGPEPEPEAKPQENQKLKTSVPVFFVIAGTVYGRELVRVLCGTETEDAPATVVYAAVATEYGRELMSGLEGFPNLTLLSGRLSYEQMTELFVQMCPNAVINAAHPYAVEVSRNCKMACETANIRYFRLLRDMKNAEDAVYVDNMEDAVRFLSGVEGNIFSACGSKEIQKLTAIDGYQERVTVRALPTPEFLGACSSLGFAPKNIICMQGPFSKELNAAMLRSTEAAWLLTKDSGAAGGFAEKIDAAAELGVSVVVIGRPLQDEGLYYDELLDTLKREFSNLRTI